MDSLSRHVKDTGKYIVLAHLFRQEEHTVVLKLGPAIICYVLKLSDYRPRSRVSYSFIGNKIVELRVGRVIGKVIMRLITSRHVLNPTVE